MVQLYTILINPSSTDKDLEKVNNKVDNDLSDNYEDDYGDGDDDYEYDDKSTLETKSKSTDTKLYSPIEEVTTQKVENDNKFTQISPSQSQAAVVGNSLEPFSLIQKQNDHISKYSVGQTSTSTTPKPTKASTERIPPGFRGTVNVEKKLHTKALSTPKSFEDNSILPEDGEEDRKRPIPDSFVTVTKSVTGSLDNSKDPPKENKNFQSTYFTKSSTCGYFTFSCNIVYGANGRSRVCRPQNPNPKGKC